ncbi:MAG: UTP--glucose-1-phosphate uridylyltransferase GalU [Candidatus Kerfeldbacteria bacterium]|nr:UTP--glucose-1-phosphate uridylyltransferase GalU [Candidatus Kerfeldbacteria bacterium]
MPKKHQPTKIRKAVIPVAGFGTRFLPMTIAQPKEMLPIVDKPIIQYVVEQVVAAGIEEVIFVTGRNKRAIEDHFDYSGELERLLRENNKLEQLKEVHRISQLAKFVFVRQNKMLGNGHAVLMAKEVVGDEPFLLCWGDDFFESRVPVARQLIDIYKRYHASVIGVLPIKEDRIHKYGMMKPKGKITGRTFQINGIVEKPDPKHAPSNYGMFGGAVLTPDIFHYLERAKPSANGEIIYTDGVSLLAKRERVYAHHLSGRYWDTGDKAEYIKANIHFALQHKELKGPIKEFLKHPQ